MIQCSIRLTPRTLRAGLKGQNRSSSSAASKKGLQGTVSPHARHLVLFAGRDYETIPSHIDTVSPLYRSIVERMQDPASPLQGFALAVTDSSHSLTKKHELKWQGDRNRFEAPVEAEEPEGYGAVVYPDRLEVPFAITGESLQGKRVEEYLAALPEAKISEVTDVQALLRSSSVKNIDEIDIFVCTHGARDCRCGDVGNAFYEALAREVRRRKLGGQASAYKEGSGPIRIHKTTHIGGHRFAATCFTSTGDWYGLLTPTDASTFLEYLEKQRSRSQDLSSIWWEKWRGRAGLSQASQLALAEHAPSEVAGSLKNDGTALDMLQNLKKKKSRQNIPLGDPLEITFVRYEGDEVKCRAFLGETLMDVAKRHDLVEATCGGACECATCHVHLPPSGDKTPPLPEITDEEDDQLEYAMFADDDSRLACQIEITEDLMTWLASGGKVKLPMY